MDVRLHEVRHGLVDELVAPQWWQPAKSRAADRDVKMAACTRAGMACMQGAVVA